jgi:hypothetical protein
MARPHRRTATRVRDGRVQKKQNWAVDRHDYLALRQDEIRIDRRDPGRGCRHLVTVEQLRAFIGLLPDWDEIAVGLDAIVLDRHDPEASGWHQEGVVMVCAWRRALWTRHDDWFLSSAFGLLRRLEVDIRRLPGGLYELRWTEAQARAFQLLDVLPHELGHHHDRITSRRKRHAGRGEPYAERYAEQVQEAIWPSYIRMFAV